MKTRVERLEGKIMLSLSKIRYGDEKQQRQAYRQFTKYIDTYRKITGKEFRIKTD